LKTIANSQFTPSVAEVGIGSLRLPSRPQQPLHTLHHPTKSTLRPKQIKLKLKHKALQALEV
jgi:hypothetical protein